MQSHPPSLCKVLCFTGGAFVIKGLPEGGEFVTYEFLVFCYFKEGKLNYNVIKIRYLRVLCSIEVLLPLLNTNQTTVILPEEGAFAHLFMPYNWVFALIIHLVVDAILSAKLLSFNFHQLSIKD